MSEYSKNTIFTLLLYLVAIAIAAYIAFRVFGVGDTEYLPSGNPLEEALECVWLRCSKGCEYIKEKQWDIINCNCDGDENHDGKVCEEESKKHPLEFEVADSIDFDRSKLNSLFEKECPETNFFGVSTCWNQCFTDSDCNEPVMYTYFIHLEKSKVTIKEESGCSLILENAIKKGSLSNGEYYVWLSGASEADGGIMVCSNPPS
jgi:hypothetical protein